MTINPVPQADDITISTAANGYLVKIGCQTFVCEDRLLMLEYLGEYLNEPNKIGHDWVNRFDAMQMRDREAPRSDDISEFIRRNPVNMDKVRRATNIGPNAEAAAEIEYNPTGEKAEIEPWPSHPDEYAREWDRRQKEKSDKKDYPRSPESNETF